MTPLMHISKWTALLSIFWIFLSGYIEPLLLSFGVISVALVIVVLKRMDAVDGEQKSISSGFRMWRYIAWLFGQIARSSIHVAKLVWGSPDKLSPSIATIDAISVPENTRVLYANSITLTPGTLSVDLEDGKITVHALQSESIKELHEGEMESRIKGLWGSAK